MVASAAARGVFTFGSVTTARAETTDGRRDGGHGDCIPGAASVMAKLQMLILPNRNMRQRRGAGAAYDARAASRETAILGVLRRSGSVRQHKPEPAIRP
jgi:hypothetical protein